MIDLKELWIGDRLLIKPTHEVGTFEGSTNGVARVRLGSRMVEETDEPDLPLDEPAEVAWSRGAQSRAEWSGTTIDLHLEKLDGYRSDSGQTPIEYQITACRRFLVDAIARRRASVLIIHGKGQGILRDAIIHILPDFPEVRWHTPRHRGGALEVLFAYLV